MVLLLYPIVSQANLYGITKKDNQIEFFDKRLEKEDLALLESVCLYAQCKWPSKEETIEDNRTQAFVSYLNKQKHMRFAQKFEIPEWSSSNTSSTNLNEEFLTLQDTTPSDANALESYQPTKSSEADGTSARNTDIPR